MTDEMKGKSMNITGVADGLIGRSPDKKGDLQKYMKMMTRQRKMLVCEGDLWKAFVLWKEW